MEADEQQAGLQAMEPEDRAAIEDALSFPEDSAGRLMQRKFVAVPEPVTVGDVIDRLRADQALTSDFWEIFIVDPMHRPVGTCPLKTGRASCRDRVCTSGIIRGGTEQL